MTAPPRQRQTTFLWLGWLLVVPVVIFSIVGVALLRRERMSIRQEATDNMSRLANRAASSSARDWQSRLRSNIGGRYNELNRMCHPIRCRLGMMADICPKGTGFRVSDAPIIGGYWNCFQCVAVECFPRRILRPD